MLKFIRSTAMKIILLVLFLAGAGFCYAFPHKVKTAIKVVKAYYYVDKGDKEYLRQNLIGAINYYKIALDLYPGHSKASYNLGNIFSVYEDYANAISYYEHALKYKPNFMNARIALGIILTEKYFEYDRAIKEYQTTIDNAPMYVNIPMIYNNGGYVAYNKSVAYHNMGLAYKWKSLIYGQDKLEIRTHLQNAVNAYKEAIKLTPNTENSEDKNTLNPYDTYDSYFNLALSLQLLGEYNEAKKVYCKCIHMRPLDYDVHYNLAILLKEQHNFLDALLELEKAALIVDSEGDGFKTRYIYDVLSETSKKLYAQEDYQMLKEKLDKDPIRSYEPTFVNGKIVASEELDKAILKNMRTCHACEGYRIE